MSTRFYLDYYRVPSDGLTTIVAPNAIWSTTLFGMSGTALLDGIAIDGLSSLSLNPTNSPICPSSQLGNTVLPAPPTDVLFARLVSDPLPAMTLAGTFTLVTLTDIGSNDSTKAYLQAIVRVISGDGSVLRGEAYSGQAFTTVDSTDPDAANFKYTEGIGLRSRVLKDLPLTPTVVQAGDRIVLELGTRFTSTGNPLWTIIGFPIGENLDDMIPVGNRLTQSRESAWIQFSQDFFDVSLAAEEYRVGLYGTVLNSDASMPFVDITSVDGLDNAPVALSSQDREGAHGGYVSSEFESVRTITLEGNIYADPNSVVEYLDQIKKDFAPVARATKLYFGTDTGDVRLVKVRPQGLRYTKTSERSFGKIPFQAQLVAQDPRIYAEHETLIGPLPVVGTDTTQTIVEVDGNRETPAKIIITNKSTSNTSYFLSILNANTDYLFLNTPGINAQEVHEIDLDARTILGNTVVGSDLTPINVRSNYNLVGGGNWLYFLPGKNYITISPLDPLDLSLFIVYRSAWR